MQRLMTASLAFGAILVFAWILGPGMAVAEDWPGLWGPERNARVAGPLEIGEEMVVREVWRRSLGGGYSEVAVVDGRGYTMFTDGTADFLIAFSLATGETIWILALEETHRGHGGSHDGPLSTPVYHRGWIFALDPSGRLFAVDAANGEPRWRRDLVAVAAAVLPGYGVATTPLPVEDLLIIQTGGEENNVVALDVSTGQKRWASNPSSASGYSSPSLMILAGRRQVVGATTEKVFGLDPADGSVLWTHPALDYARQSPVALSGNRILVVSWDESMLLEISESEGAWKAEEVWRKPVLKANYSPAVYREGYIYGMNRSYLQCLNAESGEVVWRQKVYESTLILVDGHLAVLGEKSGRFRLIKASPEGFQQVLAADVFTPGARSVTGPMFVAGRFLLRNLEEMVFLELVRQGTLATPRDGSVEEGS